MGLGDTIRRMVGDQIGTALVGESPFDPELATMLEGWRPRSMLRKPITVDPLASVDSSETHPRRSMHQVHRLKRKHWALELEALW